MKRILQLCLISLCAVLPAAYAGTDVKDVTIKSIATGWGGEGFFVSINEAVSPVEGCLDPRYYMPSGSLLFKENFSLLLSAFYTQSKVSMYVIGCASSLKVHQISGASTYE